MLSLRVCARSCRARRIKNISGRCLSSIPLGGQNLSSQPWFIDPTDALPPQPSRSRTQPPHSLPTSSTIVDVAPLPSSIVPTSPLAHLHAQLKTSPHLEPGTLLIREPIPTAVGPPLPDSMPKGRRKRGRTYLGEGLSEGLVGSSSIWSWIVLAQVKDGTEKRGAIESVIRLVRKTLLTASPPLPLPPNTKRKVNDGWAMIDAGEFAIHILSREARDKFFPERREW